MDDRRKAGGTNSTLMTKEQGKHLTLNEHDDDDDDDDGCSLKNLTDENFSRFNGTQMLNIVLRNIRYFNLT